MLSLFKKQRKYFIISVYISLFLSLNTSYSRSLFNNKIIDKLKSASVVLKFNIVSEYSLKKNKTNEKQGFGFIIDKKNGFILTTDYDVLKDTIANCNVTLSDGSKHDAKIIYYDPWVSFIILKIDPLSIPKNIKEVNFSNKPPFIEQQVLSFGKEGEKDFNIISQTARISRLYETIDNKMPQQSMVISMDSKGASNGSLIFNLEGEALGLIISYSDTHCFALYSNYILEALKYIKNKKIPPRKHIGAICSYYSLKEGEKHRNFSKELLDEYRNKFKNSRARAIYIHDILKNSPANAKLKMGDIIWKVNDEYIGPNLLNLDEAMNNASETIKLQIIRNNRKLDLFIKLYDLQKTKITKVLTINNYSIFKINDFLAYLTGAKIGSLALLKKNEQMKEFYILKKINDIEVKTLNEVINMLPIIKDRKTTYFDVQNYNLKILNIYETNESILKKLDFEYDNLSQTKLYIWDNKKFHWVLKTPEL